MPTRRTVLRSTGVVQEAVAKGVRVSFKYTDQKGVQSTRKALKVVSVEPAGNMKDALRVKTVNDLGVFRTFHTGRMTHAKTN